jgi:hypothetical protein
MKSLTAILAVAAALCLSQAALAAPALDRGLSVAAPAGSPAQQDLRAPDRIAPAPAPLQNLRSPDRTTTTAPRQDLRNADSIAPGGSLAPESVVAPDTAVASTDALSTSGGGLSTLWIVLISLGTLTLAGLTYTTLRFRHAHAHGHIAS